MYIAMEFLEIDKNPITLTNMDFMTIRFLRNVVISDDLAPET